ncbi:MAG: Fe-S-containing hydro-lyase [Acetomicrobium sp.]|nr:Fe-S-containing hydro-lyase [Acetomicrobium sp.]
MKGRKVRTPLEEDIVKDLHVGERVLLSGVIYTARDAAHRRMAEALKRGENLPFDLRGQVIYYAGPAPAPPGVPIGSIGPTTSGRMDRYTPMLLEMGLKGMIGKGRRNPEVIAAIRANGAVYFGATGGAAALLAKGVKASRVIAYEDLGPEAIYELLVEDFPLLVVVDSEGNDLYEIGPGQWSSSRGERIGEDR